MEPEKERVKPIRAKYGNPDKLFEYRRSVLTLGLGNVCSTIGSSFALGSLERYEMVARCNFGLITCVVLNLFIK